VSPFIVCGHGHTFTGCQGTTASKFCSVAPSTCGSSLCDFLHVARLTPRILRWLVDFFENPCISFVGNVMEFTFVCGTYVDFWSPLVDLDIAAIWELG
jgi:hypothetical protein